MAKNQKMRDPIEEIHHLQPDVIRRIIWIVLPLLVILLLLSEGGLKNTFYKENWLSMHSILETFSIVVSLLIFSIGWHSYYKNQSGNMIILACAFLAVGLLDYAHVMSYTGMPDLSRRVRLKKGFIFGWHQGWLEGSL